MEERLELLQNSPGDTETSIAIEKIYQEHRRLVLKICIGILHDKESAEDAFQSTFLKVTQNIQELNKNPELIRAKIILIAKNTAYDICRKNQRTKYREIPILTDDEIERGFAHLGISADNLVDECAEEAVLNWVERNEILLILERLSENQQQAVKEFYLENLTIEEIAKKHDVKAALVKQWLHRAREKLKKEIQRRLNDG